MRSDLVVPFEGVIDIRNAPCGRKRNPVDFNASGAQGLWYHLNLLDSVEARNHILEVLGA